MHGVRVITFSLSFGPKIVKSPTAERSMHQRRAPRRLREAGRRDGRGQPERRADDEFLSKSKWVRFQVYIAGPGMNILLALVVLAGVLSQGADVPAYGARLPSSAA